MQFSYTESLVTREFYNTVRHYWKQSARNLPYLRLLDYLLNGDLFDEDSSLLMLPRDLCMSMRNGVKDTNSFTVKAFVKRFSSQFFPVSLTPHKPKVKVAQVEGMVLPDWLREAWDKAQKAPRSERNVEFVSGNVVDLSQRRSDRLMAVAMSAVKPKHAKAQDVLDYMNALEPNLFEPILRNWQDAYDLALQIPDARSRKHQLAILNRIKVDPQPIYKPVEFTSRLYCDGASFLGLDSDLREVLTRDWVKLDLKQAQLHIVSSIWGVRGIHDYISRTPSGFWNDLAAHVGVCPKAAKPGLKRATYSVIYGSSKRNVAKNLKEYMPEQKAKLFLGHSVISLLFSARASRQKELSLTKEAKDAFGNTMNLETWKVGASLHNRAMSILSCQAQSYELAVLHPVIEYAVSTQNSPNPLVVTGWLHDGIWIHCNDEAALYSHAMSIEKVIRDESVKLLGFAIEPDFEMPDFGGGLSLAA